MKFPAAIVALSSQIAQGRHLQTAADTVASTKIYTPFECNLWLELVVNTFDIDASGGLNSDEYFAILSTLGPTTPATSYATLDFNAKLSFSLMACSCVGYGLGEDCCAGADAEIPISASSSTSNDPEVVDAYMTNVCNALASMLVGGAAPSSVGIATEPTVTIDVAVPSASSVVPPATTAPTNGPTHSPSVSFRLRLYWEQGYYWQEDWREMFWCMECDECQENDSIYIKWCSDSVRQQFTNVGYTIRPSSDPSLCFTTTGTHTEDRPIRLWPCSGSSEQRFMGFLASERFELHPLGDASLCLSQMHHPKEDERIFPNNCTTTRGDTTNYWITF
jgi:hypothetical protein